MRRERTEEYYLIVGVLLRCAVIGVTRERITTEAQRRTGRNACATFPELALLETSGEFGAWDRRLFAFA
jgi:hypothetical protein